MAVVVYRKVSLEGIGEDYTDRHYAMFKPLSTKDAKRISDLDDDKDGSKGNVDVMLDIFKDKFVRGVGVNEDGADEEFDTVEVIDDILMSIFDRVMDAVTGDALKKKMESEDSSSTMKTPPKTSAGGGESTTTAKGTG